MKRELRGRRVLITGASSGIGRCLAEQMAQQGARLAVAGRSRDKLEELASSLAAKGAEVLAITADVTSEADRARLLESVVERFDGLDVLVNNAGVGSWGHFVRKQRAPAGTVVSAAVPNRVRPSSRPLFRKGEGS